MEEEEIVAMMVKLKLKMMNGLKFVDSWMMHVEYLLYSKTESWIESSFAALEMIEEMKASRLKKNRQMASCEPNS